MLVYLNNEAVTGVNDYTHISELKVLKKAITLHKFQTETLNCFHSFLINISAANKATAIQTNFSTFLNLKGFGQFEILQGFEFSNS